MHIGLGLVFSVLQRITFVILLRCLHCIGGWEGNGHWDELDLFFQADGLRHIGLLTISIMMGCLGVSPRTEHSVLDLLDVPRQQEAGLKVSW